jgi:hypothetical protein
MIASSLPAATDQERGLLERAACWPSSPLWTDLTEEVLRQVAAEEGLDFATALLFDRLAQSPEHGPFLARIAAAAEPSSREPMWRELTVAVVPGAFYIEDRRSGADGEHVLGAVRHLGGRAERVPLRSFGRLEENAAILLEWLGRRPQEKVVLVSLSKGGAEVKLALASPGAGEALRNVLGWISLSGLYHGTPLVSWLLRQRWRLPLIRLLFWLRGYDFGALRQLERRPGGLLDFELRPPEHLRIIHVIGFPLVQHLSCPLAVRGHRRIGPLGPNDGGPILLADVHNLPGVVYPVWGADHYLRPAWDIRRLVPRLLQEVLELRL